MRYLSVCSGIEAATVAWHSNMRNLSGLVSGRLTVIDPIKRDSDGHVMWLCKCECGWDKARCDVHHTIEKARGGLNTLDNAVILCPNCHRIHHEIS